MDGSDDLADLDAGAASRPRSQHLRTYLLAAILVLVVGCLVVRLWPAQHAPRFCEGVGLAGPPADSPAAALAAWITADGSQPPPSAWQRKGNEFINARYNTRYKVGKSTGLQSVTVERGGPLSLPSPLPSSKWTVQGGCV